MTVVCLSIVVMSIIPDKTFAEIRDPNTLIAVIESLRGGVQDFRCEFEGTEDPTRAGGAESRSTVYGGSYVWSSTGDRRSDFFERSSARERARWLTVITGGSKGEVTMISRSNDDSLPQSSITKMDSSSIGASTRCGQLDPFEQIKGTLARPGVEAAVEDAVLDGRAVKLLVISAPRGTNAPASLFQKCWIDLDRSGRVVRSERYVKARLAIRWNYELREFPVKGGQVWMPVSAVEETHINEVVDRDGGLIRMVDLQFTEEPTRIQKLHVLESTLEINKRPPASTFTPRYQPGTPISDVTRGLKEIYGAQKIEGKPSKAEAEALLAEQIAQAERQGRELVAAPSSFSWAWPWLPIALACVSSLLLAVLVVRRRS